MKKSKRFIFGKKKKFYSEWCLVFRGNSKVYNGMFASIKRVSEGKAKNPDKVINELCSRTYYNIKKSDIEALCTITTEKLSSENKKKDKWLKLLLNAIEDASIRCEEKDVLIINETNINDYIEWDGCEIYPDDLVEIINPAWYQDGKLIEQGLCKIQEK